MTRFRPFRNGDAPILVDLWNRSLPDRNVVRPLSVHEFDLLVMGKLVFEAPGLIVAERQDRILGFVHAGFAPAEPRGPSQRLDPTMGTVAMLVVEPELNDPDLEDSLLLEAERYLRNRGASVFYCGGRDPLNPFYWGLYGGSEFAGVLDSHTRFHQAAQRAGYESVAQARLFEIDLSLPEPRDPRLTILRRLVRLEVEQDALMEDWWEALAIGWFNPSRFQLVAKADHQVLAHAWTWDIASGLTFNDGPARTGLIRLEVEPSHRRRGFGRLLLAECMRYARSQMADILCVQTATTNAPALGLYESLGFQAVGESTLYRLPGELSSRSLG